MKTDEIKKSFEKLQDKKEKAVSSGPHTLKSHHRSDSWMNNVTMRKLVQMFNLVPTSEDWRALGWLSNHSTILAETSEDGLESFKRKYRAIKGKNPRHVSVRDKWGAELRIVLDKPIPEFVQDNFKPILAVDEKANQSSRNVKEREKHSISINSVCWELLRIGFDIGNNHSRDVILSEIPSKHVPAFLEGRESGLIVFNPGRLE